MLSLAKKKNLIKIFTSANAKIFICNTIIQKYIKASDVILTSFCVKEPYPNNPLIISSDAIINPKLAGIDNNKDNSNDLF